MRVNTQHDIKKLKKKKKKGVALGKMGVVWPPPRPKRKRIYIHTHTHKRVLAIGSGLTTPIGYMSGLATSKGQKEIIYIYIYIYICIIFFF
jgi:hypothetical protein